jgi:hypothetical protein
VTGDRAEEYRRLGQDSLAVAKTASSAEARAVLVEAAEMWFRLAREQDAESADIQAPVQQQVQPKDDDKKE